MTSIDQRDNQTQSPHINGLAVDALQGVAHALTEDPARATATFRTRTKWSGGLSSITTIDGWSLGGQELARSFELRSDEPPELLGSGTAPNPQEYLLGSIAGCIAVTWAVAAAAEHITIESLEVEMHGTLDLRGPMGLVDEVRRGFPRVQCQVRLRSNAPQDKLRALHERVLETSANVEHLTRAIPLSARLVIES